MLSVVEDFHEFGIAKIIPPLLTSIANPVSRIFIFEISSVNEASDMSTPATP